MRLLAAALLIFPFVGSAAQPTDGAIASRNATAGYVWRTLPVGRTGQLITLLCRGCASEAAVQSDVPLISVLRDTLGDGNPQSDRITDVWLLSYKRPGIGKRLLSAVPFFYWRVGSSRSGQSKTSGSALLAPLLDMNALQHPTASALTQNLLQWTVLDPLSMPVRASTRAFRTNAADNERLHLQEAISFLQQAPAGNYASPFSDSQLHTLIARLELRKTLLGGFVSEQGAVKYGKSAGIRYLEIRSRNWELLRQWADKSGLYFEPLSLAGTHDEYAALWVPRTGARPFSGTSVAPIWKLLNLKPPNAEQLEELSATETYERALDENGNLLPAGSSGAQRIDLIPLGIYSLNYPKVPLLMVDFRNRHHLRWRTIEQRSINEVTAGVIGISHFTNWYYYVAAELYDFVASRHGSPMNQAGRLDCYAQFRARLALDHELDPRLRAEVRTRIDSLAMNPLESSPEDEMQAAARNFEALQRGAETGRLVSLLDKNRRRELATWDSTRAGAFGHAFLHVATFGIYTPETRPGTDLVAKLGVMRRAQYQLDFLERLAEQDTAPEVQMDRSRIAASIGELQDLLPQVKSDRFRAEARDTIAHLRNNSDDRELQARCGRALVAIHGLDESRRPVALKASAVRVR